MKTLRPSSKTSIAARRPLISVLLLGGVLAALPPAAHAEADVAAEKPAAPLPSFALTFAPLLLHSEAEGQTASMLELTGEVRLTRKLSTAVVAGAGRIKHERTIIFPEQTGLRYDVGLQARYYLVGDFRHGLQLGAEFLYAVDSFKEPAMSVRFPQPAAFAGYKFTSGAGFTIDAQIGVRRIGETMVVAGNTVEKAARVRPLLNLNVGWSF